MDAREELLQKARQVAEKLGTKTISRAEFSRETGISQNQIYQLFDGWRKFCELAGLQAHMQNVRLSDDEIFAAMRDAFIELGGITTRTRFDRAYRHSVDVFKKRGMNWSAALVAFREWCKQNDPKFPYLDKLPHSVALRVVQNKSDREPDSGRPYTWESASGPVYGEFLNFRGLQHAPVNEQGVVFLFGMIAHELGYAVERVQTGYPDCEAKRRVGQGRWERVRIEFEYKSRTFREHGHDPNGCDVVICWEHNWPECPVEVLELKNAIKSLPNN